jgi:hypothetical protein
VASSAASSTEIVTEPTTPRVARISTLAQTSRPEESYFGWFGRFVAFTGADLMIMVKAGVAALFVGIGALAVARPRRRRDQTSSVAAP